MHFCLAFSQSPKKRLWFTLLKLSIIFNFQFCLFCLVSSQERALIDIFWKFQLSIYNFASFCTFAWRSPRVPRKGSDLHYWNFQLSILGQVCNWYFWIFQLQFVSSLHFPGLLPGQGSDRYFLNCHSILHFLQFDGRREKMNEYIVGIGIWNECFNHRKRAKYLSVTTW